MIRVAELISSTIALSCFAVLCQRTTFSPNGDSLSRLVRDTKYTRQHAIDVGDV